MDTGVTFSEAWSCAASKPLDTRKVSLTAVILGGRTVHPSQQLTPDLTAALSRGEAKGLVFCPLHASTDVVTPGITLPLSRLLVKFEYSVYFVFLILKKKIGDRTVSGLQTAFWKGKENSEVCFLRSPCYSFPKAFSVTFIQ